MRDIVTLLGLLKKEVEEETEAWRSSQCLCILIVYMNNDYFNSSMRKIISNKEFYKLDNYLRENRPEEADLIGYWYKPGERQPRIEYLEKQINYEQDIIRDRRV